MSTVVRVEPSIQDIVVTDETIMAHLTDGRTISVPLAWSWRLSEATADQRAHWELIGDGEGVRWPDIDEDISAEGMLHGVPARRPPRSRNRKHKPNASLNPSRRRTSPSIVKNKA